MKFTGNNNEWYLRLNGVEWSISLIKDDKEIVGSGTTLSYGLKEIMRNIKDGHWKPVRWGRYTSCKNCHGKK